MYLFFRPSGRKIRATPGQSSDSMALFLPLLVALWFWAFFGVFRGMEHVQSKRNRLSIIHSIFVVCLGPTPIHFHFSTGVVVEKKWFLDRFRIWFTQPKIKIIHLQLEGFFQLSSCISRFLWFSGSEEVKGNQWTTWFQGPIFFCSRLKYWWRW